MINRDSYIYLSSPSTAAGIEAAHTYCLKKKHQTIYCPALYYLLISPEISNYRRHRETMIRYSKEVICLGAHDDPTSLEDLAFASTFQIPFTFLCDTSKTGSRLT